MQKIAAYLIERCEGMILSEARAAETAELRSQVEQWLLSKGAAAIASNGVYQAEDGSHATFAIEEAADGNRSWWLAQLHELTEDGRRFIAAVSITNGVNKVSVYATLEVGSGETLVNPFEFDPRCPKVIRTLLRRQVRWHHGLTELRQLRHLEGFVAGQGLAAELKQPERTVPFLVITEVDPHYSPT